MSKLVEFLVEKDEYLVSKFEKSNANNHWVTKKKSPKKSPTEKKKD